MSGIKKSNQSNADLGKIKTQIENPKDSVNVEVMNEKSPKAISYKATAWSGPLPAPEDFESFERIYPGSALLLFEMAMSESKHIQEMEKGTIASNSRANEMVFLDSTRDRNERYLGKAMFFIIIMSVLAGTFYFALVKNNTIWEITFILEIIALLGLMVKAGFFGNGTNKKKIPRN